MLLDRGVDLNVTVFGGWTSLHVACHKGHESVVAMLIDGGADLNVANSHGHTPLHDTCSLVYEHGIREAWLKIIRMLILAGADTQVRDSEGRLPVEILWDEDIDSRVSRAVYEEAVEEMDSRALRPVLK
jgi:ankyrin repeat protein